MPERIRACGYDNIKFILIFCVVLGHLLELLGTFSGAATLFRIIYSFHMPVFLFFSGFFARYSGKKIVFQLIYPYILFQILYQLFRHFVLNGGAAADFDLQFTTPYWLLWYLMAMIFYYLLLPLFSRLTGRKYIAALAVSFAVSLLVGFEDSVGYYLSLSRFFVFLPYFMLGHWAGKHTEQIKGFLQRRSAGMKGLCVLLTCGVLAAAVYIWKSPHIAGYMMFGSYSYSAGGYHIGIRLSLTVVALIWLAFFLIVVQAVLCRRIPVISGIGANTLPIFLLHGFFTKLAERGVVARTILNAQPLLLLVTVLLLLALGNPVVAKVFRTVFTGRWLELLWDRGKVSRLK